MDIITLALCKRMGKSKADIDGVYPNLIAGGVVESEVRDEDFSNKVTEHTGTAYINSIKGNTIVWNQLVPSLSTMSAQNGTISVADNVATITSSSSVTYLGIATFGSSIVLPKGGHKYLLTCEFKSSKAVSNCRLANGNNIAVMKYNVPANTWTKVSNIASHDTPTGQYVQFQTYGSFEQGDTMQVRNWNYFDLTAMGLDSITEDEFTSLFPLSYDYNAGTLLSFNGTGLKTAGFNQWDEEWEVGGLSILNGVPVAGSTQIRSKNFCPLTGGKTYYSTCGKTDGGSQNRFYLAICFYDDEQKFISATYVNNLTFVAPSNASCFKLTTNSSTVVYGNTYNNDICINISSSRNGTYEPYTSSTLSLPISTYFPTGMKSAGTAYDELTPTKAITRIGVLDLGSIQNWYQNTSENFWDTDVIPNLKSDTRNIINNKFEVNYTDRLSLFISGTSKVRIYYSGATSVQEVRDLMSGVYLYYELTDETEVDVNIDLSYKTYEGGTEQLLPENGSVPVTSPMKTNVEFDFDENINALLGKMLNMIAPVETSPTSNAYSVGQYLIYDYVLYKVTSAIASGGTITVGTNVEATTIASVLESL